MNFDTRFFLEAMPLLVDGLWTTIVLVLGSLAIGIMLGLIGCYGKLLKRGPLSWLAFIYVGVFRGLPETVLIFWIYFCGPLILDVRLSPLGSGILALSAVSGAYLTEIFRSGVLALPPGQIEAARALGLSPYRRIRHVMAPQVVKIMMPTFIGFIAILIKNSALVSAIGLGELFYQAMTLSATTYKYFEIYTAVGLIYFALIFPLSALSQHIERRQRRQRS
ncbi:His/Glu/Gln/Arg/opine family amino acid ABC transporter permease subunit [Rhodoligotrophos appendicifer]|uniref:amino acid ABC transporter permease n=1 Tax=Rhodoligotrophos appendicifer TaxID=987056 RepID=UPI001184A8EC|nr:amino acid ABC transporter permease [Rhodoligotrophos appendicifer]